MWYADKEHQQVSAHQLSIRPNLKHSLSQHVCPLPAHRQEGGVSWRSGWEALHASGTVTTSLSHARSPVLPLLLKSEDLHFVLQPYTQQRSVQHIWATWESDFSQIVCFEKSDFFKSLNKCTDILYLDVWLWRVEEEIPSTFYLMKYFKYAR